MEWGRWKVVVLNLGAIGIQPRRGVPEKRGPKLAKLVSLALARAGSDIGIGKAWGVPGHRIKSLVWRRREEHVQVWQLLRRHVRVKKGQSAGDTCEHGGVFKRHKAERRGEAAIWCVGRFLVRLGDVLQCVAGGQARCVSLGAVAMDVTVTVNPIGGVVRGVRMAVRGAIGPGSLLEGVCKWIGETALCGRVGEGACVVVLCNLNNVRIHELLVGGISVCCGLRTSYRVFEMDGSCGCLSVTRQIGFLCPGCIISGCSWECVR